ncbi:MAG: hypothetical protein RSF84_09485 [Ruthenibacterium sp.]
MYTARKTGESKHDILGWHSGVRAKLMYAFLIVSFLIILLCLVFFAWMRHEIVENSIESNVRISAFLKNSIDSGMRSTRDQSYELFFNDTVVSLVKDTEESHFKTKTTYRLCSRINDYLVGKELIDQLFWFYPAVL